jgi:hypothetical protein
MRRLIAVITVLAALGVAASSATAGPDPFAAGERLCHRQDGAFSIGTPGVDYYCQGSGAGFTDRQFTQAYKLCTRNGGIFYYLNFNLYRCEIL